MEEEQVNNLEVYNRLKQPPGSVLKEIGFGALKGKSNINPQWRIEAMTDVFGMAGVGWGYTIESVWSEQGQPIYNTEMDANGKPKFIADPVLIGHETLCFAKVKLWTKGSVFPVEAIGGSKIVEIANYKPKSNDEGYKMAVTDALGKAMSCLGVAADVYMGLWDGAKYKESAPPTTPDTTSRRASEAYKAQETSGRINDFDFNTKMKPYLDQLAKCEGGKEYNTSLLAKYGIKKYGELLVPQMDSYINDIKVFVAGAKI
jgi:hypothetical protein